MRLVNHVGMHTTKKNNSNWSKPLVNPINAKLFDTNNNAQPKIKIRSGEKYFMHITFLDFIVDLTKRTVITKNYFYFIPLNTIYDEFKIKKTNLSS